MENGLHVADVGSEEHQEVHDESSEESLEIPIVVPSRLPAEVETNLPPIRLRSTVKPESPASEPSAAMPKELLSFAGLQIEVKGSLTDASLGFSLVPVTEFDKMKVVIQRNLKGWANVPRPGDRYIDNKKLGELDEDRVHQDLKGGGSTARTSLGVIIDRANWDEETRAELERAIGRLVILVTDLYGEAARERSQNAKPAGTVHGDGTITPPRDIAPIAPRMVQNGMQPPRSVTAH